MHWRRRSSRPRRQAPDRAGSNQQIHQAILKLSVKTVETYRASSIRKLGMSSTAELVRHEIREKLVAR
ncbi:LuxR C-terminal-related transcriptional regulator [Bradyrhizobium sp. STM 3562]|uniref:LuxR C-terminal-related transcriptional regulator n=1 Tax=Bradyrhizobium sp. STM 3562 TaxID=578924 RepID=UPI003890A22A